VLKQIRGTDLVDAVRRVAAGQSLLDPAVMQRVLERIRSGVEQPRELKALTEQERRILEYVAEG
jgi:two-component system, NarL family, response regulator DevR